MYRDASFLRCSKLNCYSEFNKMVQALSVHSKLDPQSRIKPPIKGTSAEYNFYQTLSIMLQQVLSNPNPTGQENELKMIYQWFTLNKPLAPQRVKPSAPRPKLVISSKGSLLLSGRPQTAPAALCTGYSSRKTPVCPPSTPALTTFASSYMARTVRAADLPSSDRPSTQPLPVRKDWLVNEENGSSLPSSHTPYGNTASKKSGLLNVFPSTGITPQAILANTSSVAAQMTIDRFLTGIDRPATTPDIRYSSVGDRSTLHTPNDLKALGIQHRSPSPSFERSKSMTTLETISENDNEENDNNIDTVVGVAMSSNTVKQRETLNKEEPKLTLQNDGKEVEAGLNCTPRKATLNDVEKLETVKNDCEEAKNTEQVIKVPEIIIRNRHSRSSRLSSANKGLSTISQSRKACHIQVVTLSLDQHTNTSQQQHTRRPKKLVPIIAGFNQQHYRPRTVF